MIKKRISSTRNDLIIRVYVHTDMYAQLINPSVMSYTYVLITTKYFKEFKI